MRIPLSKSIYFSAAAAVTMFATSGTAIMSGYNVTLTDNGHKKMVHGFGPQTVGRLLHDEGLDTTEETTIFPNPSTPVRDGMQIFASSASEIRLNDGGKIAQFHTFAQTVGVFLHEQQVQLGSEDTINFPMDYPLEAGQTIQIVRRYTHISSYVKQISYHTTYRYSSDLLKGQTRVISHGMKGKMKVEHVVYYVNGRRIKTTVQEKTVEAAKNRIVEVGMRNDQPNLSSRADSPGPMLAAMTVIATAYTSGGQTATGWAAKPGVIAVDPSVIPLGTRVYIPGLGVVHAQDTGGAIVGQRIDICMNSEVAALNWGVRTITIYVL